jgi:hypothetical protein
LAISGPGLARGECQPALPVGVVETQNESAAAPLGEQPIEQRRAHVAHVQKAGRAGRKTDNWI